MLALRYTTAFKKDYKRVQKRGHNTNKLRHVIELLLNKNPLPEIYHDHPLHGKFDGVRDCHIEPDWVMIYRIENSQLQLVLARTGTHADLFS